MDKKIKFNAYVQERHPRIYGEKAGWKVGFQPEAAEEIIDPPLNPEPDWQNKGVLQPRAPFVQVGGIFIETTDKDFFKLGIRYEVEIVIKRIA